MQQVKFTRVSVPLSLEEFVALRDTATRECRHPQEQARYMLRRALGVTQQNEGNGSRPSEPVALGSNA